MTASLDRALGALLAGFVADQLGVAFAIWMIAGLTFLSGLVAALRMIETLRRRRDQDTQPVTNLVAVVTIK